MFEDRVAVIGAGRMGAEIAQVIAAAGVPVVLLDVDQVRLDAGLERVQALTRRTLTRLVASGRLSDAEAEQQASRTLASIIPATSLAQLGDVDLAIEAVPEPLERKRAVFAELDAATPGHAVLASITCSAQIDALASATGRPERVIGLHFFYPASVVRLVELVAGPRTSSQALASAASFLATIRKTAVRCTDSPGFVVYRVLCAGVGELWRAQHEGGLSVAAVDRAIAESQVAPVAPFALVDQIGLDVVLSLFDHLYAAYGERFHVHPALRELVTRGELGLRTGRGFYEDGRDRTGGAEEVDVAELAERFELRTFAEACRTLEDGVASASAIDVAMAAGAGLDPPPFARADAAGLDAMLERLERAAERWGEAFAPPVILRRLVAQGRLGAGSGQGFFPAPAPDPDRPGPVRLEIRGEIAILWLANPPANSISPAVASALRAAWDELEAIGGVRAVVLASAQPNGPFCAGADIKAFAAIDAAGAAALIDDMHRLLGDWERSPIVTIAAVGGLAYGGGCEIAMAADLRIAAQAASFAQPEIRLGLIPGWGGTQRLARLVGHAKALEMNLGGEPIDAVEAWELGLVNAVVPDHELLDTALRWARRHATAPPLAVAEIKRLAAAGLEPGLAAERSAFARAFASADAREGIAAFVQKRPPRVHGS